MVAEWVWLGTPGLHWLRGFTADDEIIAESVEPENGG